MKMLDHPNIGLNLLPLALTVYSKPFTVFSIGSVIVKSLDRNRSTHI